MTLIIKDNDKWYGKVGYENSRKRYCLFSRYSYQTFHCHYPCEFRQTATKLVLFIFTNTKINLLFIKN